MKLFSIMSTAYHNFDNTVNTYLQKVFNSLGISNSHSSVFTIIFNAIKGVMQNAMFYIEDALTEQNIFTASRKSSVYNLAKLSGYEPFFGSAASGTILVKPIRGVVSESNSSKIYIPNHTKVINKKTSIIYNIILSGEYYIIDLNKPLVNTELKIVEGVFHTNKFYATGDQFETFNVETYQLFDKSYFKVYVNGEQYEIFENIYDLQEDGKQCVVTVGYDNSFSIIFGNGTYGKKLDSGDNIVVEWLSHRGNKANIMSSEKNEFVFSSSGLDAYGNNVNLNSFITLEMVNCVSGGINADTIDIVKNMVGYNSRSLVIASEDNFRLFFKRFSFIGRVNCISAKNSLNIIIIATSNALTNATTPEKYLYETKLDSLYLNSDQEQQIMQSLNNSNKIFAGISLKFIKPIINRYAFIMFIKEDDVFNRELIKESIRVTLAEYFMKLPDNVEIIYKSDIINTILNNCEHIKFLDINIISESAEKAYKNTYHETYDIKNVNSNLVVLTTKTFYEKDNPPGLDYYGNIILNSKMEIPLLQGKFAYYPNKDINDRNTSINIETIQYYFI